MKIKSDHITNSSSTAYFFIFKGNKKDDLLEVLKKHSSRFNRSEDIGWEEEPNVISCSGEFLIEKIGKAFIEPDEDCFSKCKIEPIEKLIDVFKESLEHWVNYESEYDRKWYKPYATKARNQFKAVLEAKGKGLTHYVQVNFGDHEGHVMGDTAALLDCFRDLFQVRRKDLYVITDCRH